MPYYRRRYWRRRRRPLWRWRTRKAFWRRLWRRRRRQRVRRPKRKLKKITVKQWQPTTIRKLKIKGPYPLFQGTSERLGNNMTQYLDSIAPHNIPGGGLTSITKFTLEALYELHLKARNWWTHSNCSLPLIRYNGCKIKLFRSTNVDYIFVYTTCGDMKATKKLYQSTQPAVLIHNKHKRIITCKAHNKHRKPWKTLFIKPPPLFENKWYFQQEIAKIPLLMTITAAASLDRFYIPSTAISNTIGFESLNTDFFQFHNFKEPSVTTGYKPNTQFSLFTFSGHTDLKNATWSQLIYLANTKDYQTGLQIGEMTGEWPQQVDTYFSKLSNWGNPFHSLYFNDDYPNYLITKEPLNSIINKAKAGGATGKINKDTIFTERTQPLTWHCRYNPQADQSHNAVFFTPVTGQAVPWQNPHNENLVEEGLPLWLIFQGLIDFHTKANDIQHLTTDYVTAIVSDYITPKDKTYYVPLDGNFFIGKSIYEGEQGILTAYDQQNFFPKVNFQLRAINNIISTGPGTAKLPDKISAEAHLEYCFYFKLGGCPPPMDDVCNPSTQTKYPTPGNLLSTTLLQSPETPIEYYLSAFDQRRDILTSTAAKRLKKDFRSKELIFKPTGETSTTVQVRTPQTSSEEETSEEEKDPETIQLNIQLQQHKQRKLRRRILQLLQLTQSLE
nr:MAG: ORF1 [TTV-like mini virus]